MQQLLNFLLVFVGGGLGSVARFGIALAMASTWVGRFPLATFLANALACLILGFLMQGQSAGWLSESQKLLLATGFCGGFSTFSTFSAETWRLWEAGNWGLFSFYVFISLVACWLCFLIGFKIGIR